MRIRPCIIMGVLVSLLAMNPSRAANDMERSGDTPALIGASESVESSEWAVAQATDPQPEATSNARIREYWRNLLNGNTTTIISGNLNEGYLTIAYDISAVVDNGDNLRVLPLVGKGAVQNVRDVMFLKGIDMGLTNTVTLNHLARSGELGTNLKDQISYISMLFQDELHVLVRDEIMNFDDLEGKRVNFGDKGSGAQLSSQGIFAALGITVTEYNMDQAEAIEMMKRGELDATMCTCLKPLHAHSNVRADAGLKLIPVPYDPALPAEYLPTQITHEDYPNLIPEERIIETIAVPNLLIAYNWPKGNDRYRRLEAFVDSYFSKLKEFMAAPRHPRWRTVNIAAELPGWRRFPAADEWLAKYRYTIAAAQPDATAVAGREVRAEFEKFLETYARTTGLAELSAAQKEALWGKFSEWWTTSGGRSTQ